MCHGGMSDDHQINGQLIRIIIAEENLRASVKRGEKKLTALFCFAYIIFIARKIPPSELSLTLLSQVD